MQATFARLRPRLEAGRRAYAAAVRQEPEADRGLLFALADGQALEQRVLKAVDLVALFGPAAPTGDQVPPAVEHGRERSLDSP
jgi:hypothetical protein